MHEIILLMFDLNVLYNKLYKDKIWYQAPLLWNLPFVLKSQAIKLTLNANNFTSSR